VMEFAVRHCVRVAGLCVSVVRWQGLVFWLVGIRGLSVRVIGV
jgi:hypothetical protein